MSKKKEILQQLTGKYVQARQLQYAQVVDDRDNPEVEFDIIGHLLFLLGISIVEIHRLSQSIADVLASPKNPTEEMVGMVLFDIGFTSAELQKLQALNDSRFRATVLLELNRITGNE